MVFLTVPDGSSQAYEDLKDETINEDWREIEVLVEDNEDLGDKINDQMGNNQDLDLNIPPQVAARKGRGKSRKEMTGLRRRP